METSSATRLAVGATDDISPLGTARVVLRVSCPQEGRTVALDSCSECDACAGFDDGEATGTPPTVLCDAWATRSA